MNNSNELITGNTESKKEEIEILFTKKHASVLFRELNLTSQNTFSPEIELTVEKQPIKIIEGESYADNIILIDQENEKMRSIASEAELLLESPESERPRKVLDLLRSKMHYAYNDDVERLRENEPELAVWIEKNTGLKALNVKNVPLSELIEKGYGICGHLSVAFLWLAQKAGLNGVLLKSDHGVIKNIKRKDNGQKLFNSFEFGNSVSAHHWVEIKKSDGKWIPVDPSTKLVGDSEQGLAIFREANYRAIIDGLHFEAEPKDKLGVDCNQMFFNSAESTTSGRCHLELLNAKPTWRVVKREISLDNISYVREKLPPTNIPYVGEAKLKIMNSQHSNQSMNVDILEVKTEK